MNQEVWSRTLAVLGLLMTATCLNAAPAVLSAAQDPAEATASKPEETSGVVTEGSTGADVTVIYLPTVHHYGSVAGIHAYSVATTSCNVGDEPLLWCTTEPDDDCDAGQHPVIGQNLYRLKEGRFEQIGMSWLKHGFFSVNNDDSACGDCDPPPFGGAQLGVGCTDPYSATLNGSRPLGMRSEVNARTGDFPFPFTEVTAGLIYDQRIKVDDSDLIAAQNPDARYWVEGHYIAGDDASEGNGLNNASHREVTVNVNLDLLVTGPTVRELPALYAWPAVDPQAQVVTADVVSRPVERFGVGRRVSGADVGWHYEYAVHNLNSDTSARSFTVTFPGGANITNAGFRDVDQHSGEPYDTTDWTVNINRGGVGTISWSTETFANNEFANALRWGTMFSFWFDADQPPDGIMQTIGLFKPTAALPVEVEFAAAPFVFGDGFESGDLGLWSPPE